MLKYMGWSLADVGSLAIPEFRFWSGAIASLIKQENSNSTGGKSG
jgi:hypothetical protein